MEGEAVGAACEHVGVCVQRKTGILGFNVTSISGMGTAFCKYPSWALVEQKMLLVSCLMFWILLPFLLHVGSSTQTEESYQKQACQLIITSVLVRRDCLKGKSCSKVKFLKDFHTFGLLSFEKSVEEMMLRAEVFTFGDLDLY